LSSLRRLKSSMAILEIVCNAIRHVMDKKVAVYTLFMAAAFCLLLCSQGWAEPVSEQADRLTGVWFAESKDQVEIYKEENKYFGKGVVTPENKDRLDDKNPDERLRNRPLADVIILKDFEYAGQGRWGKGTIYDPNNGKTYRCTITMKSEDRIKVRGFIGISLIGRTET